MTKAMLHIDPKEGIYFDCLNHAGDYDVCTIVSTLCNVLVASCLRRNIEPRTYESGHVTLDINRAEKSLTEVFNAVWDVFKQVAEQHPDCVELY